MLSASQLNGSALTSSRLMTELLVKVPETQTESSRTSQELIQVKHVGEHLTWIQDLCVQHRHVVSISCMDRK